MSIFPTADDELRNVQVMINMERVRAEKAEAERDRLAAKLKHIWPETMLSQRMAKAKFFENLTSDGSAVADVIAAARLVAEGKAIEVATTPLRMNNLRQALDRLPGGGNG